ncbi:Protein of unknown function [Tenacibaculum sp. MAR_2009_124]|uniref:DUF2652 domain-containing protein n=1 Tax=Tenacibaculum sp. MAR_2009_124 TaxID=1250059 RepID=UPI0008991BBE|nr:DUF2652 domain-containing protein [Tenacibaculum sp. MAR_2009_124]SEC80354.1 Protein of unknown function [Tenacibaculum sp. MAR_2009_124]
MAKSLLFIPDISGFTHFVQNTEVEHSQHVIAELLEVLIAANTQKLSLAEIEGDALFFYKENEVPSQEKLLAQIETMYTSFYGHLKMMEKNRICPCMACSSAINLQLKIVAHAGDLQFLKVQNNRKPFGESVIQVHRLLKNKVKSDNYVLISNDLMKELHMSLSYKTSLFNFQQGSDSDGKNIHYVFSEINTENLTLKPFLEESHLEINRRPNMTFKRVFKTTSNQLLEVITNYKYRNFWSEGVDDIKFTINEVTRLGTEHACVIGGKHLNFKVVTKKNENDELIYGEKNIDSPLFKELYQFFNITPISNYETKLEVEFYWKPKSFIKKMIILFFAKKLLTKNFTESLERLNNIIESLKKSEIK